MTMAIRAAQSKRYKNKIAIAFGETVRHVSVGEAFSLATSLLDIGWSMLAIRVAVAEHASKLKLAEFREAKKKRRPCRTCTPVRRCPPIRMRH
jgi:hypothetical protein